MLCINNYCDQTKECWLERFLHQENLSVWDAKPQRLFDQTLFSAPLVHIKKKRSNLRDYYSLLFPIDSSCFALLVSRKYNTDLLLVNSELENGEDAITASGNGNSEVEKQTAKSAVGIY